MQGGGKRLRIKLMWGNNARARVKARAPVVATRSNEATFALTDTHPHRRRAEQIAQIPWSFCGSKKKRSQP